MFKNYTSANNYIKEHADTVNQTYRPLFHMCPTLGWMNDPNGLIYKDGVYHLYYQANPYGSEPGKMGWGHFISKNLIEYKDVGIALYPSGKGENAFSGGAIQIGEKIHIYYTLHTNKIDDEVVRIAGEDKRLIEEHSLNEESNEQVKYRPRIKEDASKKSEEIYHSISDDGRHFHKGSPVFDNDTLPEGISRVDFRDPSPVKIGKSYYLFLGARDENLDQGCIVVLKGNSLDHFEFDFLIGPIPELGFMGECPCYRKVGRKDVLIASSCGLKRNGNSFKNMNSSIFIVGELNLHDKKMDIDYVREIDKGDSFYAPQFISGSKEATMVAWLEMWDKHYVTKRLGHNWVGCFTIPRILKEENGEIIQSIIPELYSHLEEVKGDGLPKSSYISLSLPEGEKIIIKGEDGSVEIGNDGNGVYLDNRLSKSLYPTIRRTDKSYKDAKLEILLDVSALEVFVDGGRESISTRVYLDGELTLQKTDKISNLVIKEVVRKP